VENRLREGSSRTDYLNDFQNIDPRTRAARGGKIRG
jgi:hypothetical protein